MQIMFQHNIAVTVYILIHDPVPKPPYCDISQCKG